MPEVGAWLGLSAGSFRVGVPSRALGLGAQYASAGASGHLSPAAGLQCVVAAAPSCPRLLPGAARSEEPAFALMFTVGLSVGLDF